jgi:mono/diheme cytochrome c family protein
MKTVVFLSGIGVALLLLSMLPWLAAPEPANVEETAGKSNLDSVEYGRQLFFAKGCIGCHRHAAVPLGGQFLPTGPPNLTDYDPDPAFVRRWLADPQAVRPGTEMPDLDLSEEEIEALIAFLDEAGEGSR